MLKKYVFPTCLECRVLETYIFQVPSQKSGIVSQQFPNLLRFLTWDEIIVNYVIKC